MFNDFVAALKVAGLTLDAGKSEWTHNLAVCFPHLDEQREITEALRTQVIKEFHDSRRQIRRTVRWKKDIKRRMQTRQRDDSVEAWVANILDKHDFDIEEGRLQELMKTCADAQAQLSELHQTDYEPPCLIELDGLIIGRDSAPK